MTMRRPLEVMTSNPFLMSARVPTLVPTRVFWEVFRKHVTTGSGLVFPVSIKDSKLVEEPPCSFCRASFLVLPHGAFSRSPFSETSSKIKAYPRSFKANDAPF